MRLTKYHKDAFVTAVMADVPKIDYQELARVHAVKLANSILPPELLKLCAKYNTLEEKLRVYTYMPGIINGVYASTLGHHGWWLRDGHPEVYAELEVLAAAFTVQRDAREELEGQVRSAIAGCTTLKSALKALPEFAEYLPADVERTDNLPMISTIVASLTLAGWPKDAVPA